VAQRDPLIVRQEPLEQLRSFLQQTLIAEEQVGVRELHQPELRHSAAHRGIRVLHQPKPRLAKDRRSAQAGTQAPRKTAV